LVAAIAAYFLTRGPSVPVEVKPSIPAPANPVNTQPPEAPPGNAGPAGEGPAARAKRQVAPGPGGQSSPGPAGPDLNKIVKDAINK
jgi:hypothetical protein